VVEVRFEPVEAGDAVAAADPSCGIFDCLVDAREEGGCQSELERRTQREPLFAAMVGEYTFSVQHRCTKSAASPGFQQRNGLT